MDRLWQVLLRSVVDDAPLSCDDCVVLMDYLADLLASDYPSKEVLALAERYLQRCPDCNTAVENALAELELAYQDRAQSPEMDVPGAQSPIVRGSPWVASSNGGLQD